MAGQQHRLLLRLASLIFFLVLLRTKFLGQNPSSGSSSHPTRSLDTVNVVASEQRSYQGTARHLLDLDGYQGLRSREWKQNAGKSTVPQTGIPSNFRRGDVTDPHLVRSLATSETSPNAITQNGTTLSAESNGKDETFTSCKNVNAHIGFPDSCSFVRANSECQSGTIVEYAEFFYCTCAKSPTIAYLAFMVWLMALFYMLGNTAADFFCCSLEKLSKLLHLPPTVAGVSLLPLGNGAPDVFASIAAFMGSSHGQVKGLLLETRLSLLLDFVSTSNCHPDRTNDICRHTINLGFLKRMTVDL